jgi:hypothetical protein
MTPPNKIPDMNVFDRLYRYGALEYIQNFKKSNHRGCTNEEIHLKLDNILSHRAVNKQIERLIAGDYVRRRVISGS